MTLQTTTKPNILSADMGVMEGVGHVWPQDSGVLCPLQDNSFIDNCCLNRTWVNLEIKTDNYYLKYKDSKIVKPVNLRVTLLHSVYMLFEYHRS